MTLRSGEFKELDAKIKEVSRDQKDSSSDSFSGNYNDLSNKPTIPSDVSDLTDSTGELRGNRVFQINEGDAIPAAAQNGDLIFEIPI